MDLPDGTIMFIELLAPVALLSGTGTEVVFEPETVLPPGVWNGSMPP